MPCPIMCPKRVTIIQLISFLLLGLICFACGEDTIRAEEDFYFGLRPDNDHVNLTIKQPKKFRVQIWGIPSDKFSVAIEPVEGLSVYLDGRPLSKEYREITFGNVHNPKDLNLTLISSQASESSLNLRVKNSLDKIVPLTIPINTSHIPFSVHLSVADHNILKAKPVLLQKTLKIGNSLYDKHATPSVYKISQTFDKKLGQLISHQELFYKKTQDLALASAQENKEYDFNTVLYYMPNSSMSAGEHDLTFKITDENGQEKLDTLKVNIAELPYTTRTTMLQKTNSVQLEDSVRFVLNLQSSEGIDFKYTISTKDNMEIGAFSNIGDKSEIKLNSSYKKSKGETKVLLIPKNQGEYQLYFSYSDKNNQT